MAEAASRSSLAALLPTDPLELHGMKAGTNANDHGPFRAAATVAPADLTDSSLLHVPPDDLPTCEPPHPTLTAAIVYRRTSTDAGDPLELRADVLTPPGDGPFPTVVYVPGGGFVLSPRDAGLIRRMTIAARGHVVVSVEYRTLRHGTHTDGVADVAAAVDWVRAEIGRFGGDPDRIALWGESAGGYLASMAVTTGAAAGIRAVVSTFGLTDLAQVAMDFDAEEQARHRTPAITEAQYVFGRESGATIVDDPDAVQRANPVRHVSGDEPPYLLLHGEIDGLVSPGQSQLLHRALLDAGVDSERVVVAGAGHYGIEWSSATVLHRIAEHLARHLAGDRTGDGVGRSAGPRSSGPDPQ